MSYCLEWLSHAGKMKKQGATFLCDYINVTLTFRPNFAKLVETFASLKPEAESKSVPERDIGKAASEG
eukprot:m.121263 g.121263  ORF g.121263 m.121263 type:complete len:68 (+) comp14386_c0_seq1:2363-2566(+)